METPLPEETIRGRNLCCLSKQIKFQRCNKTEVWLKAIAEATTDTLQRGFLIKAATAIIIWQMVAGFHIIKVITFLCSYTAVYRKKAHTWSSLNVVFMFGGGGVEADTSLEYEKALSLRVLLPEKERLSSGPLWSNLLRQHINYKSGLWCHLLQTGQILIERSRYKKHRSFVSFHCNVTHAEWEEMRWIIISRHSVQESRGL